MKTLDFCCQTLRPSRPIFLGVLCCLMLSAHAEPPPPEVFTQTQELVLTLPDEWMDDAAQPQLDPDGKSNTPTLNRDAQKRPGNLGCGMDVSDYDSESNSLTSRMVGKCNVTLRY